MKKIWKVKKTFFTLWYKIKRNKNMTCIIINNNSGNNKGLVLSEDY